MCGLFGMTLARNYPTHLLDRGAALALLGELAEDGGRDAAGIAARYGPERWTLGTVAGPYRQLSRRPGFNRRLASAQTAIGHTRWATQGSLDVANASPTRAGRIVTILSRLHGRAALAWTDTAYTDRHGAGGRVWLARAGLSPLAVGGDVDGGLWWASNPA